MISEWRCIGCQQSTSMGECKRYFLRFFLYKCLLTCSESVKIFFLSCCTSFVFKSEHSCPWTRMLHKVLFAFLWERRMMAQEELQETSSLQSECTEVPDL